jgi:hypothetical protein
MLLRPNEAMVHYNAACTFCSMNRKSEALDALSKAWRSGFTDSDWARRDPDLTLRTATRSSKLYPKSLKPRAGLYSATTVDRPPHVGEPAVFVASSHRPDGARRPAGRRATCVGATVPLVELLYQVRENTTGNVKPPPGPSTRPCPLCRADRIGERRSPTRRVARATQHQNGCIAQA